MSLSYRWLLKAVDRWAEEFRRNSLFGYAAAVLLAVIALPIRLALNPWMGRTGPYITFVLAAATSAALGGFRTGMVTSVAGFLLAGFIHPPGGWLHLVNPSDPFESFRFLVSGAFISYLCELLISRRDRARTAEQRLQESQRIYRAIGESIPFGIWIRDAKGHHVYASQATLDLIRLTQQDLLSEGWGLSLHPDDEKRIAEQWRQCVRERGNWDTEMRLRGVDGQWHPVLTRGVPVLADDGRVLCWAGINLDISRLKAAEIELKAQAEELKRSNRDLEQFAFVASHDMREPLRMVNIYAELLLQRMTGNRTPELDQFAGFIREGVTRMERLIQDLLSFSRVIHAQVQTQRVDAGRAVQDALAACEALIKEAGAEVIVEKLPAVLTEQAHLTQVFQNLISNAVKFRRADAPARVRISATMQDGLALFRVDDNGMGFEPQYALKIFELFARLHGSASEGTGLGLAICQSVVERYGGRIWAESKPGEGSAFFFTVPAAPAAEAGRSA